MRELVGDGCLDGATRALAHAERKHRLDRIDETVRMHLEQVGEHGGERVGAAPHARRRLHEVRQGKVEVAQGAGNEAARSDGLDAYSPHIKRRA